MDEAREIGGGLNEEPPAERFHYRSSGNLTQTKLSVKKKRKKKERRTQSEGRFNRLREICKQIEYGLDIRAWWHRSRDRSVQRRTR
jgi:hypothetical protein